LTESSVYHGVRRAIDAATVVVLVAIGVVAAPRVATFFSGLWSGAQSSGSYQNVVPAVDDSTEILPAGMRLGRGQLYELSRLGLSHGDSLAPFTVYVFEDFNCGWCSQYDSILSAVSRRYRDHMVVVRLPFLLDTTATTALDVHSGLFCAADQGLGGAYHEAAYQAGSTVLSDRDGWRRLGSVIDGLGRLEYDRCVLGGKYVERIKEIARLGRRFGFKVTPSSIVGRTPVVGSVPEYVVDSLVGEGIMRLRANAPL
jgi:protein-disulfide isomerase